jgi:hypothetical protein
VKSIVQQDDCNDSIRKAFRDIGHRVAHTVYLKTLPCHRSVACTACSRQWQRRVSIGLLKHVDDILTITIQFTHQSGPIHYLEYQGCTRIQYHDSGAIGSFQMLTWRLTDFCKRLPINPQRDTSPTSSAPRAWNTPDDFIGMDGRRFPERNHIGRTAGCFRKSRSSIRGQAALSQLPLAAPGSHGAPDRSRRASEILRNIVPSSLRTDDQYRSR